MPALSALAGARRSAARPTVHQCYRRRTPETDPLYQVMAGHLETFLERTRCSERQLPAYVERELRAYLQCGILSFGFLRARCQDCGQSRIVAFSCKKRGFCPSCTERRMADTAARLTDEVLQEEPLLAALTAASIRGTVATGERAGKRVRRRRVDPQEGIQSGPLCFSSRGFSPGRASWRASSAST